ncbi:MAG: DUF1328 domain-containing protein [Verrucomicrobia bacterium]|nr:DUF1328 domain-containing protein [Verrucomicrobiota bacterium]
MIGWTATFLIIALVAGLLSLRGINEAIDQIAKMVFYIFGVLFLVFAIYGLFFYGTSPSAAS